MKSDDYSDFGSGDAVRRLLTSVDQTERPSADERSRIYSQMMDAAASPPQVASTNPPRDAEVNDTESIAETDLVVVDVTNPIESAWHEDSPHKTASRVLGYAAALIVIAAGFLAFARFGPDGAEIDVVGQGPELQFDADIGGVAVSFAVEESVLLDASSDDFLTLRSTAFESPFPPSEGGISSLVIIARPSSLFGGLTAEAWFAEAELQVTPAVARHQGTRIDAWNVVVTSDVASALGCEPREPCIEFASLGADRGLSLEAGFGFNSIRLIPTDGGEPLVVFSVSAGPAQGPSDDPINRISAQILATLTF